MEFNAMQLAEIKQRILDRCVWEDGHWDTPCLVWTGARSTPPNHYGKMGIGGKFYLTHRLMQMACRGQIASDLCVCHRCSNPPCCEISHLYLATNQENMTYAVEQRRWADTSGKNHARAKLTEIQVSHIRYFLEQGWRISQLAKRPRLRSWQRSSANPSSITTQRSNVNSTACHHEAD